MSDITFVKEVLEVLNTNTQIISELRMILAGLKDGQCDKTLQTELKKKLEDAAKDISELKVIINTMASVPSDLFRKFDDLERDMGDIKDHLQVIRINVCETLKISKELNVWSKIKLPFIIATITIILWAIGMFYAVNKIDEKAMELLKKTGIVSTENNTTK